MRGTFRAGDMLFTEVIPPQDIRLGDVLVFCSRRDDMSRVIAHRAVARVTGGCITQGDAMRLSDADPVYAQHLLGRVIQVQRGRRVYPVKNGWRGRSWVHYLRFRRRLLSLVRTPYHWLRASKVIRRLWRPPVASVMLTTAHGPVVKYLCGGKTVAVWQPETRTYWCRKPYDLVLDAPGPTTNVTTDDPRINE